MIPQSRDDDSSETQDEKPADEAGIVRRAFGHGPGPEEELARVLAERRTELEDYAARFEETALDLGRRERALQDERASVERLLRRSTTELEAREKELVQFERELAARDEQLRAAEGQLADRRSDLGAVELKRAALEQRERALERREAALTTRGSVADGNEDAVVMTELFFVPGSTYRLLRAQSTQITVGGLVEVEGERFRVARMGPSPLPGDSRRCAYLVAGGPPGAAPDA